MKVFRLAALIVLVAGPAFAGDDAPHINMMPEIATKSPEEKAADEVRDRAYRESLKKIPDAKVSSDPWGTVRAVDAPRASAPAKPRTKTGSNTN